MGTESILPCAEIGNSVEDIKSFMMENPLELDIDVTTYNANLQYECPLAQEFLVNSYRCRIFVFFLLSFPQNERKIYLVCLS